MIIQFTIIESQDEVDLNKVKIWNSFSDKFDLQMFLFFPFLRIAYFPKPEIKLFTSRQQESDFIYIHFHTLKSISF